MKNCKILIVEDDELQRVLLEDILKEHHFLVKSFASAEDALSELSSFYPEVVITDVRLPGMDGMKFFELVKSKLPETEVIIITAFSNVEDAVNVIKKGAFHYLTKPFSPDVLLNLVKKACELVRLKRPEVKDFIVYRSEKMQKLLDKARAFAKTEAPVLILGESGVGKELVAKYIWKHSGRKGKFVSVNCAALPGDLFEAELFGYEKGAFTGANSSKPGLIEEANEGCLFLDEIGELPLTLQPKLLRFLQEGEIRRLGGVKIKKVNVKLLAATNQNLKELVKQGKFREDLYYRINVLALEIPPLRERKEDIVELANYFLGQFSKKYEKTIKFSKDAIEFLESYPWPGNVRELENTIHRLVITCEHTITKKDLEEVLIQHEEKTKTEEVSFDKSLPEMVAEFEKTLIKKALEKTNYVQVKAASLLGIDEKSLRYKRKKYGI